ncbi:MAG: UDP-glucose 4-epimerase GalE [Jannaschia sp.]
MANDRHVLITGGAGYIGSHTTLALNAAGYTTIVYDDFSTGHRDASFGNHLVEGRLDDTDGLAEALRIHDVGSVLHFAALIEAGQSVVTPLPFFRNNMGGSVSLLEAMERAGTKRIVLSSTAAVYGNGVEGAAMSEDLPRQPINPYGESKAMVETVLEACVAAHGLQAMALRYFNASGADADGRTGERHDPETHLIPLVIQAAMGLRSGITVNGTDYDTPDGTCIRDYIHVTDLARGHVAALEYLLKRDAPGFTAVNLGTGEGRSVREVIAAVAKVSGVTFPVVEAARRAGDPATLVADPSAARARLGWRAEHSDLERIVADAWRFAQSRL